MVIRHFERFTQKSLFYLQLIYNLLKVSSAHYPNRLGPSSFLQTALEYLVLGIEHIVPKGLDHILFIIGIFFYSSRFKPLIGLQVTMFTSCAFDHTLILASFNLNFYTCYYC